MLQWKFLHPIPHPLVVSHVSAEHAIIRNKVLADAHREFSLLAYVSEDRSPCGNHTLPGQGLPQVSLLSRAAEACKDARLESGTRPCLSSCFQMPTGTSSK